MMLLINGAEGRQSGRRCEGAARQRKSWFQREAVRVLKQRSIVLKENNFRASNAIAPREPDRARTAMQIDM